MPIQLYGSWFSPFARKVALALELKGLAYEMIDALARDRRDQLVALNPRGEVPVVVDDGLVVVNSADIVQYLEWRYPAPALYPEAVADRVAARSLERLVDVRVDGVLVNCSYWSWAIRDDEPPAGLQEAGQSDLDRAFGELEAAIAGRPKPWPFGAPGVLECAWYPHLAAVKPMGFALDPGRFPATAAWFAALRAHPVFRADARRTATFLKDLVQADAHERRRICWRGDRLEWLFARGFFDWFAGEVRGGRAFFPD